MIVLNTQRFFFLSIFMKQWYVSIWVSIDMLLCIFLCRPVANIVNISILIIDRSSPILENPLIYVAVGLRNIDRNTWQIHNVSRAHIHPDYEAGYRYNNIAILELETPYVFLMGPNPPTCSILFTRRNSSNPHLRPSPA